MIKLLIMDVDGTLTDGKIYMGPKGESMKAFSVQDGYAIAHILRECGIEPIIITARKSKIVERRSKELGIIEVHQGCKNKMEKMIEIAKKKSINVDGGILAGIAYIGDDEPDLECIRISEISGCPSNATENVKKSVDYICSRKGGDGAVREFVEWLVNL